MSTTIERVSITVARLGFPLVASRPRPGIVDPIVRAALLADLALSGALTDTGTGLEVDTTSTGFAPADQLLHAVVADPSRQLGWWLTHAPVSIRDIADVLVHDGHWDRHGVGRRYREVDPASREAELNRVDGDVRRGTATPTETVSVALLEQLPIQRQYYAFDESEDSDRCGAASWLVPDLLAALARRQALIEAAGRDARNTQSAIMIV